MAVREIVKIGDPILRTKSREVEAFDAKLGVLLDDMAETMQRENGAGLAAVQVGILKRAAVIKTGNVLYELINPVLIKARGEMCDNEGCLSVPNQKGEVIRPETVTVRAFDRKGNAKEYTVHDFTARVFCHEMDHMDGILFTDKLRPQDQRPKRGKKFFGRKDHKDHKDYKDGI